MKNKLFAVLTLAFLSIVHPQFPAAFAQGSLTPSGAPTATMKALDQIEPRTPISSLPFTITNAGSYYLTTNLTGVPAQSGITISASGVTLDLMGFELAGVSGTSRGVNVTGSRTNIAIRNGTVRNWTGEGVYATNAANSQFKDLRLSANGNAGLVGGLNSTVINCTALGNAATGIIVGEGSIVKDCTARNNGGSGISAGDGNTVTSCSAVSNTVHGISAGNGSTVSGCTANINTQNGISVGFGSTVKDCTAVSNVQNGIFTSNDCTVSSCTTRRNDNYGIVTTAGNTVCDCTAGFNGGDGIRVGTQCLVRRNNCASNGRLSAVGAGIYTESSASRIEENNVTANDYGILCNGLPSSNVVVRNTASANTVNYQMETGNKVGPIVAAPSSGYISGSTGGAGMGTTDPWANFSY